MSHAVRPVEAVGRINVKPHEYSEIEAKVAALRRRSLVRAVTGAGMIMGALAVVAGYFILSPPVGGPQLACGVVMLSMALGTAVGGALFGGAAMLVESVWLLAAGKKRPLPTTGDAARKTDAAITDTADG